MKILPAPDSRPDFLDLSVEEQFKAHYDPEFEKEHLAIGFTLKLISYLRASTTGPEIYGKQSHGKFLLHAIWDTEFYPPIMVSSVDKRGWFVVRYTHPKSDKVLPWRATIDFTTFEVVQTTIAIVHALQSCIRDEGLQIDEPEYVNDSDPIEVIPNNGEVHCPHCSTDFRLENALAWNGESHVVCHQKLSLI